MSILLLIVMLAVDGLLQPASLLPTGLELLGLSAVPLVFASLSQSFIIVAGDIDLSIGYSVGLASVLSATLLVDHVLLGILSLLGIVAGYALMAIVIHKRQVPSLVITLGVSFVWLGIGLLIQPDPGGTSPNWLTGALDFSVPIIPETLIVVILVAALVEYIMFRRHSGRIWRAFGSNSKSLREAGWSPLRARTTLYVLAGLCAVVAGLYLTVGSDGSDILNSNTYTLTSIAAVIFGGGRFSGGRVSPVGTVAAALALTVIGTFLSFLNVSTYYVPLITGLVLLFALVVHRVERKIGHIERNR